MMIKFGVCGFSKTFIYDFELLGDAKGGLLMMLIFRVSFVSDLLTQNF